MWNASVFGLSSEDRSSSNLDKGLYARDATRQTYARLRALAQQVLRADHAVVVDATFLDRSNRDEFRALAASLDVPFRILTCRAAPSTLRDRVAARQTEGEDASDAGLPVLERQLEGGGELDDDEQREATAIDTSALTNMGSLAHALGLAA